MTNPLNPLSWRPWHRRGVGTTRVMPLRGNPAAVDTLTIARATSAISSVPMGFWLLAPSSSEHVPERGDARTPMGDQPLPVLGGVSAPEFEPFVREHERALLNFLWRMTGDEQSAYDLTQETFLRAWRHYATVRDYQQPRAWLFRVATNLAISHQRRRTGPVGGATSLEGSIEPGTSDPARHVAEGEAVRWALLRLSPKLRAVLVLREVYDLSAAEAGRALGMKEGAVKMALWRARAVPRHLSWRGGTLMSNLSGSMPANTPACVLGLDSARLSAYRDAHLTTEETQRIGAHVPTCTACGRTLAKFEAVAVALKRQKELEPGNRVWRGILAKAEQGRGRRGANGDPGPNGRWRGIGALVAVAAVLALFILVLGSGRFTRQISPNPTTTASVSPTTSATSTNPKPNFTAQPQPTTPTFTPPTPNVAFDTWAASAKIATVNTQISSSEAFMAQSISPDGKTLLGAVVVDGTGGAQPTYQAATFDLATHHATIIPGMPSTPSGYGPPGCCQEDGRFLVAMISSAPGATCGICHNVVWYYDTQTGGQAKRIPSNGAQAMRFSQGYVAIDDADDGIEVANLATGQITQIVSGVSGSGSQIQGGGNLLGLSAPYVFYAPGSGVSGAAQTSPIHVHDLATGQDAILSQLDALETANAQVMLELDGTTLYATVTSTDAQGIPTGTTLYALPNFSMSDTASAQQVATPNPGCGLPMAGFDRLLSCFDAPTAIQYYYDRDQGRYVIPPNTTQVTSPTLTTTLTGHYWLAIQPINQSANGNFTAANAVEDVTIYDLNQVPTRAG